MPTVDELKKRFPRRPADAHKGDFGHVLVVAGSLGYTGAAYLAGQAAILSGSGLVTLAAGRSIYPILAAKLTEVMVRPFIETKDGSLSLLAEKDIIAFSSKCSAVAIGPGISQNSETQRLVCNLITRVGLPTIVDADGITALVGHGELIKQAGSRLVLTPHPGEMARLIGTSREEVERSRKDVALSFAREYNTVLILKGSRTIVAAPGGDSYINETGNVGMATGGTGDVLTGIIASFLGQGMDPFSAGALAVWCHGLAGDLAAAEKGTVSLIATDLLQKLPEVLKTLA